MYLKNKQKKKQNQLLQSSFTSRNKDFSYECFERGCRIDACRVVCVEWSRLLVASEALEAEKVDVVGDHVQRAALATAQQHRSAFVRLSRKALCAFVPASTALEQQRQPAFERNACRRRIEASMMQRRTPRGWPPQSTSRNADAGTPCTAHQHRTCQQS